MLPTLYETAICEEVCLQWNITDVYKDIQICTGRSREMVERAALKTDD
jgi:hypothetical protein